MQGQSKQATKRDDHAQAEEVVSGTSPSMHVEEAVELSHSKPVQDPEKSFDDFYLRQVTQEFANDLDKLRSAKDFSERSVKVLVEALKQGSACFSVEEREKIAARFSSATGG